MAAVKTVPEGESAKPKNTAGLLLIAVMVILVLCAVVYWWNEALTLPGFHEVTKTAEPPRKAKPQEVAPPPAQKSRPVKREEPQRVEMPQSRPFPAAENVRYGMEKAELLKRFGSPSMVTTSVEQGQEVETLVYMRRGPPKREAVVVLRGGSVVSVNSVRPTGIE